MRDKILLTCVALTLSALPAFGQLGNAALLGEPNGPIGPPPPPHEVEDDPDHGWHLPGLGEGELPGLRRGREFIAGDPDALTWILTGGFLVGWGVLAAEGDTNDIESVGDVFQWFLPASAGGFALGGKDTQGFVQLLYSITSSTLAVSLTKDIAEKMRPNAASNQSFPSGHAAASWTGASYMMRRYGTKWGVPYITLSTYTAYSRVYAQKHHFDDVLAGASYALFLNWAFVTPVESGVELSPVVVDNAMGLGVNFTGGSKDPYREKARKNEAPFQRNWRYQFDMGPSYTSKNEVVAPREGGTPIDFDELEGTSNPTTHARGEVQWTPGAGHHEFDFVLSPNEQRDFGVAPYDVNFAGVNFPAGTDIRTSYYLYEYRLRYRYRFFPEERFKLNAGASLSVQDAKATLASTDGTLYSEVDDLILMPLLHLSAAYHLSSRWSLEAEIDAMAISEESFLDTAAYVRYRLSDRWDFGLGWRVVAKDFDTAEWTNDYVNHNGQISIGYSM